VMKVYGFVANGVGVVAGGVLVARLGLFRALFVAGLLAAATNLLYSWLAMSGNDPLVFRIAVVADNFTGGMATVAFVAYLSSLCNVAYTATQYALLASVGNLGRIWLSATSGWMVDRLDGDWSLFFAMTAGIALLGLPLLLVLMRRFPEAHVRRTARDAAPA
jgi:MFS transporter, PAT family, beta-lactamase induction signal transducer AmpG